MTIHFFQPYEPAKAAVLFFSEDTTYRIKHKRKLKQWVVHAIQYEGKTAGSCNFILCTDNYLLEFNRKYLHRNTYTDVIAFDQSASENVISGDIYISIDRIRENAKQLSLRPDNELHRVMIHGVLHLLGYSDESKNEKQKMAEREQYYLDTLSF